MRVDAGQVARAAGRTAKWLALEVWFWVALPFRVLARRTGLALAAVGASAIAWVAGWPDWVSHAWGLALVVAVAARIWWHTDRTSYDQRVTYPAVRRRRLAGIETSWPTICERSGLMYTVEKVKTYPGMKAAWVDGRIRLRPRMVIGQDLGVWEKASETIRVAAGANRIELRTNDSRTSVELWLSYGDALTRPFRVTVPASSTVPSPRTVTIGRTEDGGTFVLRLGVHTLVAGSTGSGKASAVHGLLIGLGPAVRAGVVQVQGIDLKGGMELGMAVPMLACCATNPVDAVAVLEQAAESMAARANRFAGRTRVHEPSKSEPLVLVLIDELAGITAYLNDRDLKLRAANALSLLLSQGRAVGFVVVACLQDPRKEVIPMRGLFTQTLGLRLRDSTETDMVVGKYARELGAACELISPSLPGVGWYVPDHGQPVRFRLGHVTDDDIRLAARRFPSAKSVPIPAAPAGKAPVPRSRSAVTPTREKTP